MSWGLTATTSTSLPCAAAATSTAATPWRAVSSRARSGWRSVKTRSLTGCPAASSPASSASPILPAPSTAMRVMARTVANTRVRAASARTNRAADAVARPGQPGAGAGSAGARRCRRANSSASDSSATRSSRVRARRVLISRTTAPPNPDEASSSQTCAHGWVPRPGTRCSSRGAPLPSARCRCARPPAHAVQQRESVDAGDRRVRQVERVVPVADVGGVEAGAVGHRPHSAPHDREHVLDGHRDTGVLLGPAHLVVEHRGVAALPPEGRVHHDRPRAEVAGRGHRAPQALDGVGGPDPLCDGQARRVHGEHRDARRLGEPPHRRHVLAEPLGPHHQLDAVVAQLASQHEPGTHRLRVHRGRGQRDGRTHRPSSTSTAGDAVSSSPTRTAKPVVRRSTSCRSWRTSRTSPAVTSTAAASATTGSSRHR